MFGATAAQLVIILGALLATAATAGDEPRITRILPSAAVELRDARGLSVSGEGWIYIADTGRHRVIAVDDSGRVRAETGGLGAAHGQFRWPQAVIADRGNAVWVLDYGNRRIEKFSRLLEWQGTLDFGGGADGIRGQPTAMAISSDGDVYVYDRDGGRMLRFDPFFRRQAELGSGGGGQFVNDVTAMTVVRGKGVFWIERGGRVVRYADPLLNATGDGLRIAAAAGTMLASADSCLIVGSRGGIVALCGARAAADTLLAADALARELPRGITAVAAGANRAVYVLDGKAGHVFRITPP